MSNIPIRYFLSRLGALRLGGRWELAFMVEETAGVFINSAFSKFKSVIHERNYIFAEKLTTLLIFNI